MPIAPGYIPIYNDKGVVIGSRLPNGTFSSALAKSWWDRHGGRAAPPTPTTPGPANGALDLGNDFVLIYGPAGELLGYRRKSDGSYGGNNPAAAQAAEKADLQTTPVKPFNTPEEEQGRIQGTRDYKLGELDIDEGLDTMRANTAYEKTLIDRNLLKDTNQTVDAMIARGLMQSGIKDTAVWDLTQQATLRKTYLDTSVALAEQYGEKRKKFAADAYEAQYGPGPDSIASKQSIRNADEANRSLVPAPRVATPYIRPRTPATQPSSPAKPRTIVTVDKTTGGVRAPDEW